MEDVFRIKEIDIMNNFQDIYADFMNTIISMHNISKNTIINMVLDNRFWYETTNSLGRFAANILGQVPNARLLDAYSGNGYFDCDYLGLNKTAIIDGYEINPDCIAIAKAINYIFNICFDKKKIFLKKNNKCSTWNIYCFYLPIIIKRMFISLGLIPEILLACPIVSGSIFFSFCRASVDKE